MKTFRLFFVLFLVWAKVFAQTPEIGFDELAIQQRVKQLDEFVKRFNYETDIY